MILELAAFALGVDPALLALLPADLFVEQDGVELFDATHFMDPSAAWAAGGIVSTPDDAAVFMHALLSGQMLEDTYLDQMETFVPILLLGSQTDYGLGLIRYQTKWGDAFGHGGLIYGYEAAAMYLPLEDLTLSHMHSTFPTQSWLLSYEAFQVVLEGKELPQTVCQPPAEIREPVLDEPYLSFRFRGLLNKDKDPNVIGGIAAVRGFTGGDPWILSGLGSAGKVTSGMMTRVEVDSLGPAFVPPVRARQTIVSFDTSLLAGASQNPRLAPGPLQKYALVTLVGEIEIDAATQQATRICFVAVNDLTRDWSAYVCDPAAGGPVVGSTLKVWGNVPLTTDPAQVEAYLTPIQIPRCSCNDGSGSWQACE
jgi:hypothetical protein